jgi:hypothetical protein
MKLIIEIYQILVLTGTIGVLVYCTISNNRYIRKRREREKELDEIWNRAIQHIIETQADIIQQNKRFDFKNN